MYLFFFIYVCTFGNTLYVAHVYRYVHLACHLNHTTTLEKGATTVHRWSF